MLLNLYHLFWGNETYKTLASGIKAFDTGRAKQLAGAFTYDKTKPSTLAGYLHYQVEDVGALGGLLSLNLETVATLANFLKGEVQGRKKTLALFIKNEKQDVRKTLAESLSLNYEVATTLACHINPLVTAIRQIGGTLSSEKTRQGQMAGYMKLDLPPYEFIRVSGA